MSNASTVPVLQDEINRKAFETMEWLTNSLANGSLSARQFSTGVDALFMGVAGLVSGDIMEMMTLATHLANSSPQTEKVFLIKGVTAAQLAWTVGKDLVEQTMFRADKIVAEKTHTFDNARAARAGLDKLTARLADAGYLAL